MNVGIKGYSDKSYKTSGALSSAPVFRNISTLFGLEYMLILQLISSRGNEADIIKVAKAVSNISPAIPVQVMRFIPFGDAPIELEPSIGEAENLCTVLRGPVNYCLSLQFSRYGIIEYILS